VHFERLTIEAGDAEFALPFHPRLTVIAGVGRPEREGLVGELVGALGAGRSGVHLEMVSDAGTRYALRRPTEGSHQVIDLATGRDVTSDFVTDGDQVNVLERAGLSVRDAKRAMRLTESDLATRSEQEERILALAQVDQNRLWEVARKVKDREAAVAAATAGGADPDDTAVLAEIERRHSAFEEAEAKHEQARRVSLLIGANAAVLAVLLGWLINVVVALPLIAVAITMTVYSALTWRRMVMAYEEEEEALREAGAHSYLTFQIHRVNGLLADDHHRRQMMKAAEYHRAALAEWHLLASDVPVDWALEHRGEIRQAAARLHDTLGVRAPVGVIVTNVENTSSDLAHTLLHRLNEVRTLGAGGESFPLFLDDPFGRLDADVKAELLGLLVKASELQQVVLLTEDEQIAAWARVEAMTGHLAIVEPASNRNEKREGGGGRRHAVA
jgi:hypothetical protein